MKILTLAAGRGSRLKELTQSKPKCLTEVQGKPILHWQQLAQKMAGVNSQSAVLGYKAELIKDYFDDYFLNEVWDSTNMVTSLTYAAPYFRDSDVIISYSDIVYSPSDLKSLNQSNGDIVVAYDPQWLSQWSSRFEDPLSDAETFKLSNENEIIEIGKKPTSIQHIEGQFLGLIKVSPKGWNLIYSYLSTLSKLEISNLDMTSLLQNLVEKKIKINAHAVQEKWFEIDSESDLKAANQLESLFNWVAENE